MRRLTFTLIALVPLALFAQGAPEAGYRMPPKEIAEVVDAPPPPIGILSPDGHWLLLAQEPPLLTIADLSQPELKLAGVRFNPVTHDQSRLIYHVALKLVRVADGQWRTVTGLPASSRTQWETWSPDSSRVAFTLSTRAGAELWVVDTDSATARRVSFLVLNQSLQRRAYEWLPDSRSLVVRSVPAQSTAPEAPATPKGPAIQESRGRKAAAPTYEDMLHNESDAAIFEYHMQSKVVVVSLDGRTGPIGATSMIIHATPSPDGRFLLVETLHRPFSYTVPWERFPRRIEIWSTSGQIVRQIADQPLADQVPIDFDAVRTGPRDAGWRADRPATAFWVEALDQGNPRNDVPFRDRLLTLSDPFTAEPAKLMDVPLRFARIEWGGDDLALVESRRFKDRKAQTWRLRPAHPDAQPELIFDRSYEDRYSDPGDPVMLTNAAGKEVLRIGGDGHSLFYIGLGASPEGARPFADRFDIQTRKATRLFRSAAPDYELPIDVTEKTIITRRESVTEPCDWLIRDPRKGTSRTIVSIPNPTPQLANVKKELIHYKRADGLDLNGTLYLPPDYDQKNGPLPVLMWAYPLEFKSAAAASQVITSPYRFTRPTGTGSPIVFVLRGYAVLDNPTIPIVGEGAHEPNDTYVEQLVAGARAAIDELVRRGVGDRNRMSIAGHSYGAFMTANLLANSDLFRAGIARSGAYNRTLTPFRFQSEERNYWEVPQIYTTMSPFMHADRIKAPLLLIHGMEDDNTGTFPIQSERLFQALSGLGGTVRLVMLPKEAHGYRGRESVMHVLWEMDQWLDRYVKNAPASNPFASASPLPYQAPAFDKIKDSDFQPAIEEGMARELAEMETIANNPEPPTFANTIEASERAGSMLRRVQRVFGALTQSNTNPTLQKIQSDEAPKLAAHRDAIYLNPKLFARVNTIYDQRATSGLDPESTRLVERYHRDFVRAGALLPESDKITLRALNKEQSQLTTEYRKKVLAATNANAIVIDDKAELAGLSDADIAAAAEAAKSRGLSGKWVITLQNTTQQPAQTYLKNRALRERLFKASSMRANGDESDTRAIDTRLAQLRAQRAKLLGFPSYAAFNLDDEMAKTPDNAIKLMTDMVPATIAKARGEAARMQRLIDQQAGGFKLQPWDWQFYAEQVRKAEYDLDESQVRPYFEVDRVLRDGVFFAANKLYGITFKERKDIPLYQTDVRVFEVFDSDGKPLALFYADFFSRPNKSGGAWTGSFVGQSNLLGTKPAVYNVENFTKPAPGQPALLSFTDVTTMFHEFGHALHGMFSNVKYPTLSGSGVPRDFVEFPSQFNEHWALEPTVFANYARHYQTSEPMPKELVDKIKKSRTFNQGFATTEYLAAALLDMAWHTLPPEAPLQDVNTFEPEALKRYQVDMPEVPPRYRTTYFSHIWGSGYAAGYYAYLWSEVLDDDAYYWFREHGGMTRANGQRYRDMILSRGGTEDPAAMYRAFRGRDPVVEPLLEERGLKKTQ